jgi:hypothetical protein
VHRSSWQAVAAAGSSNSPPAGGIMPVKLPAGWAVAVIASTTTSAPTTSTSLATTTSTTAASCRGTCSESVGVIKVHQPADCCCRTSCRSLNCL